MKRHLAMVARGLKQLSVEALERVRDYQEPFILNGCIYSYNDAVG